MASQRVICYALCHTVVGEWHVTSYSYPVPDLICSPLDELKMQMLSEGVVSAFSTLIIALLTHRLTVQSEGHSSRCLPSLVFDAEQPVINVIERSDEYRWDRHRGSEPLVSFAYQFGNPSTPVSRSVPPDMSGDVPAPSVRSIVSHSSVARERDGVTTQQSLVSFDGNNDSAPVTVGTCCRLISVFRKKTLLILYSMCHWQMQ